MGVATKRWWVRRASFFMVLMLGVAACGGDDANEEADAAESEEVATTPSEAATTEGTETEDETAAVEQFYSGVTMEMIIGRSAGGGNDLMSRLLATHLSETIPGQPDIVPLNDDAAGGLAAENGAFAAGGATDGSAIVNINHSFVIEQVTDGLPFEYEHRDLSWIGSLSASPGVCVARSELGLTLESHLESGEQLNFGATAPGSTPWVLAKGANAAVGTNFNVVTGYDGSSELLLAISNGELDGICIAFIGPILEGITGGTMTPLLLLDEVPAAAEDWAAALEGVPVAADHIQSPEGEQVLNAVVLPNSMVYAYAMHPDVPAERVEAVRAAFDEVVADPAFADAVAELGIIFSPKSASEVEALVSEILSISPDTLAVLSE